jgi:hypothetical protein
MAGFCCGLGFCGLAASWSLGTARAPHGGKQERRIDFNRDVRPILSRHCWPCHGNDKEALQLTGNLRLDTFEGATSDRYGRKAVFPGHPEKSMMLARISAEEGVRMPPKSSGIEPLTAEQRETLRLWIEQGAVYRGHWAFEPPKMPALPSVENAKWARNPIDRFILSRLEKEDLGPEKEADRTTLIRRVTLALTGLPPTPAEVQAFLSDRRPDAYERLIDRLLSNPRYGENQARYWLDAVRYADTHGLHIDNERAIFPYRDWVVRAYNADLPFDKFATWQLAGDLLPHPDLDQMIATGYVRMNPTTAEGGVIEAEVLANNTFDRVDTTATIFMGLTMGCAKCHDHKYDPLTIKDYYRMYAFFNSTQDPALDGNLRLHQPVMKAPTPDQQAGLAKLRKEMDTLVSQVDLEGARSWLASHVAAPPAVGSWEISGPYAAESFDRAYDQDFGPEQPGKSSPAGWKSVEIKDGVAKAALVNKDNAAAYIRTSITAAADSTFTLRLGSDDAIKVWLNGRSVHANKVLRALAPNQDSLELRLAAGKNDLLVKVVNAGGGDGLFFSISDERSKRLNAAKELLAKGERVSEALSAYLELGPDSALATSYRKALAAYRKLDEEIPFTYIAKELPRPRPTYVLKRGSYATPGEQVDRNVPEVFGGWKPGRPRNRLGFAQWLFDPGNPLTARVYVNRVWQQHFGSGLVRSPEDFGSRGEWPSHPELLDYLAVRFVKEGWSLKRLHRLILTSAAYRQSSGASRAKRAKDPLNTLLSRGPRFRLDAEVLRDQALYLSGLLVERPGGRGDKPYQPPGLWEAIAYPISDTARYVQDQGEALYRRSIYLFWKRTSPPPAMLIFDAPMREACVVQRSRTNTPTQALVSLNETGFVEAARKFAERVLMTKKGDAARLNYAFRLALARSPRAEESAILLDLKADRHVHYRSNVEAATKLLRSGESKWNEGLDPAELAAWTLVCNALLNLDETMTLQ